MESGLESMAELENDPPASDPKRSRQVLGAEWPLPTEEAAMKMVRFEFQGRTPEESSNISLPLRHLIFHPIRSHQLIQFTKKLVALPQKEREAVLWELTEQANRLGWKAEFEKDGRRY